MNQDPALYAFELGREKELCLAELIAVLGEKAFVEKNLDTAIFELKNIDPKKLQNSLGGTIKIVKIFGKTDTLNENRIKEIIKNHLEDTFEDRSGKIPFSLSILSIKNPRIINTKEILNFSKKILKSLGLNSRFVNQPGESAKPATIYKARVVEKGVDINIIKGNAETLIGQTVAIQNLDAYTIRDYEKPYRDARAGMMPPKLAQIMINLAGKNVKQIYDPFCGTGTILCEGLLMGKSIIGSDISGKMVDFSKKNCEWIINELAQEFPGASNPKENLRVFEKDALLLNKKTLLEKSTQTDIHPQIPVKNLCERTARARNDIDERKPLRSGRACGEETKDQSLRKTKVFLKTLKGFPSETSNLAPPVASQSELYKTDAIITEGYLGEPLSTFPSEEKREKIFRALSNLHLNWLRKAHEITKEDLKIVMCVTAFQEKIIPTFNRFNTNQRPIFNNKPQPIFHLPHFEKLIKEAGFKIENMFTYGRSNQTVVRDIMVLTKIDT